MLHYTYSVLYILLTLVQGLKSIILFYKKKPKTVKRIQSTENSICHFFLIRDWQSTASREVAFEIRIVERIRIEQSRSCQYVVSDPKFSMVRDKNPI